MKFIEQLPIDSLVPAPYNPRRIDEDSFSALVESIKTLGVIRPIIVTDKLTILAGHQRTKAMKAAGLTHTPAYMATGNVTKLEEMRFNQYHNRVDSEDRRTSVHVPPGEGWEVVDPAEISGWEQVRRNSFKNTVGRMILLHGPWSNIIANESGQVLVGSIYAAATAAIGYPLLVRYVPDDWTGIVSEKFGREYGEFNYENISMDQWGQASHQPVRKIDGYDDAGAKNKGVVGHLLSTLWEQDVMPYLTKGDAILDFGSGRGAYAKAMRTEGYEVLDVEFYRRKRGSYSIDHVTVQKSIDKLCEFIASGRQFDVTILDSVLNSVGKPEGEKACMTIINALCRPGGQIAFSGKSLSSYEFNKREDKEGEAAFRHQVQVRQDDHFFDRNGNTAVFVNGFWRFQKFHRMEEVEHLARTYIGPEFRLVNMGSKRGPLGENRPGTVETFRGAMMWQCTGFKATEVSEEDLIAAVEYEFSLPYRSGRTVDRVDDVMHALKEGGFLTK